MKIWYRIFKIILSPIYKFYYNPKIYGKENLKIDGPLIIAGNHIHLMDQCNVIISTNKVITYLAKKEYFLNPKTRWFFKMVGCIPVDRSKKDENAKIKAINVLKNKGVIGIFPEGTRNKTNEKLLPFKYGAVKMAEYSDAYIVPFGITGTYKFRSKDLKVKFGKPFKVTDLSLTEANALLFNKVKDLIDELNNM